MAEQEPTYAVIRTGGKQYRVAPGERVRIEKLEGETGDDVVFGDVLLLKDGESVQVGRPTVTGARVTGKILRQFREKKILVFKKKRKKGYKKLQGHRQNMTEVFIQPFGAGA